MHAHVCVSEKPEKSRSTCKTHILLTTLLNTLESSVESCGCGVADCCGSNFGSISGSEELDEELEEPSASLSTAGSGVPSNVKGTAATES